MTLYTVSALKLLFLMCGSPLLIVIGCEQEAQSVGRALSFTLLVVGMFMVLTIPDSLV